MLAVKTDNTLWGWGDNSSNQLSNLYNTQTPTLLMTDVQDTVACSISSMAIKTDGSLWIWGNGNKNYGEAPDGVCYGSYTDQGNGSCYCSLWRRPPSLLQSRMTTPYGAGVIITLVS